MTAAFAAAVMIAAGTVPASAAGLPKYESYDHSRTTWLSMEQYNTFMNAVRQSAVTGAGTDGNYFDTGIRFSTYEEGAGVAHLLGHLFPTRGLSVLCNNGWSGITLTCDDCGDGESYHYYGDSSENYGKIYACWKSYADPATELLKVDATDAVLAQVLAAAPAELYERCKFFHDWIINNFSYDRSLVNNDMYSLVCLGSSTCRGYADAFLRLCYFSGIDSALTGVVTENNQTKDADHYRNAIMVDGHWYMVDTTWDDLNVSPGIRYDYFWYPANEKWQNFLNGPFLVFV